MKWTTNAIKQYSYITVATILAFLLAACGAGDTSAPTAPSLLINTGSLPAGFLQQSYDAVVATSGGTPPLSWKLISGALPTGLQFDQARGGIHGKPTEKGTSTFGVEVSDSANKKTAKTFSIDVVEPLEITTTSLPTAEVGSAYQVTLEAAGGTAPLSWRIASGSLPAGLQLEASTGTISGTPSSGGLVSFSAEVSDSSTPTKQADTQALEISLEGGATSLSIETTSLPSGQVNLAYNATLSAMGGTPSYTWRILSGALPLGLMLGAASGEISGTPSESGQFSFTVEVEDSTFATSTGGLNMISFPGGGDGSALAGGLLQLPPPQPLGTNQLIDSSFENGGTNWTLPNCFTVDSTTAFEGQNALKFQPGSGCGSFASQKVTRNAGSSRSYTLRARVKRSSGSDLGVRIKLHDSNDNGFSLGGSSTVNPGPEWELIEIRDFDLLPIHDGHTLSLRVNLSGTTGSLWVDQLELVEQLPHPLSAFLLDPNFRGYLWENGPEQIRLQVEVASAHVGQTVRVVLRHEGGDLVQTVERRAEATQVVELDGSSLSLGTYLLETELLDGSTVSAGYPPYRITKVPEAFRTGLTNYIDTDNFLVQNGQKHFVWGVYDRFSSARCSGCLFTDENSYETKMAGFDGVSTLDAYVQVKSNVNLAFSPHSGIFADQLAPWLSVLSKRGIGHLQTVNNWVDGHQFRPSWASELTDFELWQKAAGLLKDNPGALGYYTYDETKTEQIPVVFAQARILREGNPGSVTFGTLIDPRQIYRWRDVSDVVSSDPYPIGVPVGVDDAPFGATIAPPMMRTSVWTRESVRQVHGRRPVWMVLQLWRQRGEFPTYEQMRMQAYKAIINGATGILWWGFVSGPGIEGEWYNGGNSQAYFDFRRLSEEVMGLETVLVSTAQPDLLTSVSNPGIEVLVKKDADKIVVFASNFSEGPLGSVTLTLSPNVAVGGTTVEVYGENRNLILTDSGSIADTFGPYEVHIYVLPLQ